MDVMSGPDYVRYTFRPAGEGGADDLEVRDLLTAVQPAGWEEEDEGRTGASARPDVGAAPGAGAAAAGAAAGRAPAGGSSRRA